MARWLMIIGGVLLAMGAVLHFAPGFLNWFGRLPGDINIESEKGRIFIPVTSTLVISVVASIILTVLINLFKR